MTCGTLKSVEALVTTTLKQTEGTALYVDPNLITDTNDPSYNPDAIGLFWYQIELSEKAQLLNQEIVWRRMESFVSYRWHSRSVEWLVEGMGDWEPPLEPATISGVEVWNGEGWTSVNLSPSPFGGVQIPDDLTYRIIATVGTSSLADLTDDVKEAFRRLANYVSAQGLVNLTREGASILGLTKASIETKVGESMNRIEIEQNLRSNARALEFSGAGDLLRKYRKGR